VTTTWTGWVGPHANTQGGVCEGTYYIVMPRLADHVPMICDHSLIHGLYPTAMSPLVLARRAGGLIHVSHRVTSLLFLARTAGICYHSFSRVA
jgi:hypothetical protein